MKLNMKRMATGLALGAVLLAASPRPAHAIPVASCPRNDEQGCNIYGDSGVSVEGVLKRIALFFMSIC